MEDNLKEIIDWVKNSNLSKKELNKQLKLNGYSEEQIPIILKYKKSNRLKFVFLGVVIFSIMCLFLFNYFMYKSLELEYNEVNYLGDVVSSSLVNNYLKSNAVNKSNYPQMVLFPIRSNSKEKEKETQERIEMFMTMSEGGDIFNDNCNVDLKCNLKVDYFDENVNYAIISNGEMFKTLYGFSENPSFEILNEVINYSISSKYLDLEISEDLKLINNERIKESQILLKLYKEMIENKEKYSREDFRKIILDLYSFLREFSIRDDSEFFRNTYVFILVKEKNESFSFEEYNLELREDVKIAKIKYLEKLRETNKFPLQIKFNQDEIEYVNNNILLSTQKIEDLNYPLNSKSETLKLISLLGFYDFDKLLKKYSYTLDFKVKNDESVRKMLEG